MKPAHLVHRGRLIEIVVHNNEYISNVIQVSATFFELEILEYVRTNYPQHCTIVDIGANIGNHALFFWNFLEPTRLICFEPFPPNFALLKRNVGSFAELHPQGIGDRKRRCGMRFNENNLGICMLDDDVAGDIEVITLDSLELTDVSLIKIDVEGDDVAVLRGAKETIRKNSPLLLVEGDYERIFPEVQPLGYGCTQFWPKYSTYCFEHFDSLSANAG